MKMEQFGRSIVAGRTGYSGKSRRYSTPHNNKCYGPGNSTTTYVSSGNFFSCEDALNLNEESYFGFIL